MVTLATQSFDPRQLVNFARLHQDSRSVVLDTVASDRLGVMVTHHGQFRGIIRPFPSNEADLDPSDLLSANVVEVQDLEDDPAAVFERLHAESLTKVVTFQGSSVALLTPLTDKQVIPAALSTMIENGEIDLRGDPMWRSLGVYVFAVVATVSFVKWYSRRGR